MQGVDFAVPTTLPVQSLLPASMDNGAPSVPAQQLLANGQALEARVQGVDQVSAEPPLYRLRIEVQNRLLELMTSRPLETGTRVTLSQGSNGNLTLSVQPGAPPAPMTSPSPNTTAVANSPLPAPATVTRATGATGATVPTPAPERSAAATALQLQIPAESAARAATLLPLHRPQAATVSAEFSPLQAPPGTPLTTPASTPSAPAPTPPAVTGQSMTPNATRETLPLTQLPVAGNSAPVADGRGSPNPSLPTSGVTTTTTTTTTTPATLPETASAPAPTAGSTTAPSPTAATGQAAMPTSTAIPASTPSASAPSIAPPPAATNPVPRPSPNSMSTTPAPPPSQAAPQTPTQAASNANPARGNLVPAPAAPNAASTAPAHRVNVQIAGQGLELLSPRPLRAGLEIELTRSDTHRVQLQIPAPRISAEHQTQLQESLQQILRETLPQQLPLGEALQQLRQFATSRSPQQDAIGRIVQSMLSLFSVAPDDPPSTTQSVIQRHLAQSGFSQPQPPVSGGRQQEPALPQHLERLSQLAEKLPSAARERMHTLLDGITARRSSQQIESVQRWREQPDGAVERQYRLDLPVRVSPERLDNTEIRISQHRQRRPDGTLGSEWSINLHFDLEQLGAIDARISLQQEWQLSARFWAERPDTVQAIRTQLANFETQLRDTGFDVDALHVQLGRRPNETQALLSHRLVDLHT